MGVLGAAHIVKRDVVDVVDNQTELLMGSNMLKQRATTTLFNFKYFQTDSQVNPTTELTTELTTEDSGGSRDLCGMMVKLNILFYSF